MTMNVNIEYHKMSKKELYNETSQMLYKLRYQYNFWFVQQYIAITKPLNEVIEKRFKKHNHKVILYKKGDAVWFVVFTKKFVSVYYTCEPISTSYYKKKLDRWYEKANEDLASKEMEEIWENYRTTI